MSFTLTVCGDGLPLHFSHKSNFLSSGISPNTYSCKAMTENFDLQPTLEDSLVILQPLQASDFERLFLVASDPDIWEQHPAKERSQQDGFVKFFSDAIKTKSAFLIIDKNSKEIIGTSRYNLSKESSIAIEIGWTFLAKKYWGGTYNRAIKTLMIEHAFKHFDIVLFYIDKNNFRSQKSVEKFGARRITSINGIELETRPTAAVIYSLDKLNYK
jgi:RimJ/RimL family protein N-acetyltransferase